MKNEVIMRETGWKDCFGYMEETLEEIKEQNIGKFFWGVNCDAFGGLYAIQNG